jgi:glycosyltransferase involved in cell wall biosynthesis
VKTKYVRTIDVTVVIPTHNRREQILRALASLTVQSMAASRYEVVVGIDGSTDGTADALAALSLPYAFRWAYQTRQGPGAARNLGAEHAVGDVLVFLDDDHTASVQLLARHWSHHCGDEMVIVQGYYPVSPHALHDGSALLFDRKYRAAMERLRRGGCADLWGGNYSIRRDSFMSVGGYSSMSFDQGWGIENVPIKSLLSGRCGTAVGLLDWSHDFGTTLSRPGALPLSWLYCGGRYDLAGTLLLP